jgi:hypothetical protein
LSAATHPSPFWTLPGIRRAQLVTRAALVWCVLLLGCDDEAERARQTEAAALVHALEQLREAPNAGKRPLYRAFEQLPCGSDELCDFKRVCSKAYERHLRALDTTRSLRHALKRDGGVTPAASAKAARLADDAQRYLERARFLNRRCVQLQGQVKQAYDL